MPRWFTAPELSVLDDLTANNKAVLASLGGRPAKMKEYAEDDGDDDDNEDLQMRGVDRMEREPTTEGEYEKKSLENARSHRSHEAVRQRMGSITRAPVHKTRSRHRQDSNNDEQPL
jgi:hypothetical protein